MTQPNDGVAAAHGWGDVLALSTIRRFTSRDVQAFEIPTGREEDWRFTPLKRLRGLHDGTARHTDTDLYSRAAGPSTPGVAVELVQVDDPRLGQAVAPPTG